MNINLMFIELYFIYSFSYSYSAENNVCHTLEDYYEIADHPHCEYNIAADDTNVIEIGLHYGYPVETHKIITKDHYIITMFRILKNKADISETYEKQPVFLHHGWLNSARNFFGRGNHSLPFLLSDAGYDVWLGNGRGNEYAEEHLNLTVHDAEYWDYSMDEMALIDVASELDYIAEITTKRGKIVYIAHSLGTTFGLMYSAALPQIAKETVELFIFLAPAWKLPNVKAPLLKYFSGTFKTLVNIARKNDLMRLSSQTKILRAVVKTLCFESPYLMQLCVKLMNLLLAGPYNQMSLKTVPVYLNQIPSGTSLNILPQLADLIKNKFGKYDYGDKNVEKYGSKHPPEYDISKIKVPIHLFYAVKDYACTAKDSEILYDSLPDKVKHGSYKITDPDFNHFDFLYGKNAKSLVYDKILDIIN